MNRLPKTWLWTGGIVLCLIVPIALLQFKDASSPALLGLATAGGLLAVRKKTKGRDSKPLRTMDRLSLSSECNLHLVEIDDGTRLLLASSKKGIQLVQRWRKTQ